MRGIVGLTAAIGLSILLRAAPAAAAEVVKIGVPNWPSVRVTASVLSRLISQDLGTTVVLLRASNAEIFSGMDAGGGVADVHPEVWLPNQAELVQAYVTERGTVELAANPYSGAQGICVTRETFETHRVRAIFDLLSPTVARLFDADGDGKGELWVGASGWASTNIERLRARQYGYDRGFELRVMEESAALAALEKAAAAGRPYALFCYAPHFAFVKHEISALAEPAHDADAWRVVSPDESADWETQSSVEMAPPPARIHIAFAKSLRSRAPEVARFLDRVALDSDLVSRWSYEVVIGGRDPDRYAEEWVRGNTARVKGWLDASASE